MFLFVSNISSCCELSGSSRLTKKKKHGKGDLMMNRSIKMKCVSCQANYETRDAGTCKECYKQASETEYELKLEIDGLKAKVEFLRSDYPLYHNIGSSSTRSSSNSFFSDVILVADDDSPPDGWGAFMPVPAHKTVLANRSPVFKAMIASEMEESRTGTIRISDTSYEALRAFVSYLYTAEACPDEQLTCELLILAEKYQVKHLKTHCENLLVSKLNWESAVVNYAFAHQHNAKHLLDAALSLIKDNMDNLTKRAEYIQLVEKEPRLVFDIYEACLSRQVNTAVINDS